MEVRCPNCGWTSEMTPEAISTAIATAEQQGADHHIEHCPRCQWVIRVPLEELRAVAVETVPEPAMAMGMAEPEMAPAEAPAPDVNRGGFSMAEEPPAEQPQAPAKKSAKKAPAKKSAKKSAKKAPAKKSAKKSAKKAPAKKSAKKSAKKAPAKKSAKKTTRTR